MDPLSFPILLDKYLTDALTPAEEQVFFALLELAPNQEILRQAIDARAEGKDYSEGRSWGTSDYEGLERAIRAQDTARASAGQKAGEALVEASEVLAQEAGEAPAQAPRARPLYPRFAAAAAAVVLLLGVGTLWVVSRKPHPGAPRTLAQATSAPVHPASDKAILQLGNGGTIILDSAHTGVLASQGGIRVIKTDSGQLRYQGSSTGAVVYNQISTPRGGQYQLVLPDGSKIWLNAASSIRFPTAFTGGQRIVSITGEAYFEIAPDKTKPFSVRAGGVTVDVLGTHFDVMAYADEAATKTTLLEGSVRVKKGAEERLLSPGQQALAETGLNAGASASVLSVENVDTAQAVAWKNGLFEFDHLDLGTIMRQISRWYDVDVDYEADYSGSKFSGGINRSLNLSVVLRMLDKDGIHSRLENGKVILIH